MSTPSKRPCRYRFSSVGPRLRALRLKRGLTMVDVAACIGIKKNKIGALERGQKDASGIRAETLVRYADFYGVTIDYLIAGTERTVVESDEACVM